MSLKLRFCTDCNEMTFHDRYEHEEVMVQEYYESKLFDNRDDSNPEFGNGYEIRKLVHLY